MRDIDRIYVAGHRGLVGSALVRRLEADGYANIITRTSAELDLTDQQAVAGFFAREKPDYVFLAAAKVGGIHANNTFRGEFIYKNLMIQSNIMHQSYVHGVKRLLFLGSSCIYPKYCSQPIKEEYLLTGPLETTNSPYAVAKISGIEMCWAYNAQYGTQFIPVMPTNLYGPNDNFNLENSHVLPALIRKFHLAKLASDKNDSGIHQDEARFGPIPSDTKKSIGFNAGPGLKEDEPSLRVVVWGSGTPKREFLHVTDMADACVFVIRQPEASLKPFTSCLFNIGTGQDHTINELALLVKDIVGYEGKLAFDQTKPDGTPQKLLDIGRLEALGWQPKIKLHEGISQVYQWYLDQCTSIN